jgi:superfamily I DNA/RNA helicase
MKTIILGPPGTGKTTTLLNLVDEFIQQGVRPKQIGYFSFTKKAAREAANRASEKFGLDIDTDLSNFRTLHSYAFRMLGMTKEKMMKTEDYREFGQKCGIPIKTATFSAQK